MRKLDPAVKLYHAERKRRLRRTAPLIAEAKREYVAQTEAWQASRRSKRTPRGIKRAAT